MAIRRLQRGRFLSNSCPIQFVQHAPGVDSPGEKRLNSLCRIRQGVLQEWTQCQAIEMESGVRIAQGSAAPQIASDLRLELVRVFRVVDAWADGIGEPLAKCLGVESRHIPDRFVDLVFLEFDEGVKDFMEQAGIRIPLLRDFEGKKAHLT